MSTPTGVQRLAWFLRHRLEETQLSTDGSVSVDELQRRLLPYHLCRSALGLTTKAEYDLLILDLIGESGFVRTEEPLLATEVRRERASPEPGLEFLHRFAASRLRMLDTLAETISEALPESGPVTSVAEPVLRIPERSRPRATSPPANAQRAPSPPVRTPPVRTPPAASPGATSPPARSTGCWSCAKRLPDRRGLRYCPHCGVDQTVRPCPSCDAELELDWQFCPLCGEPAGRR